MTITGQRLRALREQRGQSQEEIAKLIGVGRTTYLKYESGENKPTRKIKELSALFGVTSDYIMGLSDNPKGEPIQVTLNCDTQRIIITNRETDIVKAYRTASDRDKGLMDTLLDLDSKSSTQKKINAIKRLFKKHASFIEISIDNQVPSTGEYKDMIVLEAAVEDTLASKHYHEVDRLYDELLPAMQASEGECEKILQRFIDTEFEREYAVMRVRKKGMPYTDGQFSVGMPLKIDNACPQSDETSADDPDSTPTALPKQA